MDGYTASQRGLLLMGPATEGQGKDSPADRLARLEDGIRALADQLEKEAYEAVPEDYAKRNLHRKYIASDCEAGGKDDAAERLRALLDE